MRGAGRDRVGDMVRLVVVVEAHRRARSGAPDDVDRDPVAEVLTEVGVEVLGPADRRDHRSRVRRQRQRVDALVPHVRRGEQRARLRRARGRQGPMEECRHLTPGDQVARAEARVAAAAR